MIENFLTTEQVAKILQVHPFTILKFLKLGKLRGVKLGRVYRIKESDVQAFLDGRMTGGHKQNITPQQSPLNPDLEHLESHKSETEPQPEYHNEYHKLLNQQFSNPTLSTQAHANTQHLSKPHSETSDPYTLRQDKNREDGPPHYII